MRAAYEDLSDLWWKLCDVYDLKDVDRSDSRWLLHDSVFCKTLETCNWTLEEWNYETNMIRKGAK